MARRRLANEHFTMKELLEPVLKFLPTFVPNFYRLATGPKTAIVEWVDEDQGDLTRPFAFVACTVAIGFLLQLPILGKGDDFVRLVSGMAVFKVIALVVVAAIIHLLFRLVRGRASFGVTLSTYLYAVSPLYLLGIVLEIISHGILRSYDQTIAAGDRLDPSFLVSDPVRWAEFEAAAPGLATAYMMLGLVKIVWVLAWLVVCWGAFRRLHGVGWFASTVAGVLSLVIGGTAMWGLTYMMMGMFGTPAPILR